MREKIDVGEEGQLDGRRGGELAYVNLTWWPHGIMIVREHSLLPVLFHQKCICRARALQTLRSPSARVRGGLGGRTP